MGQILPFTIGAEFIIVMPTSWAITSVMSQPCCPTSHSSSVLVAMHDVERKLNFGSVLKLTVRLIDCLLLAVSICKIILYRLQETRITIRERMTDSPRQNQRQTFSLTDWDKRAYSLKNRSKSYYAYTAVTALVLKRDWVSNFNRVLCNCKVRKAIK